MMCSVLVTSVGTVDWFNSMLLHMSGSPRVFDGKTCACDELIHVVHHVWLTVN